MALKQPKMIGRKEELSLLSNKLETAVKGAGSTIFIAGEAGLGKTRLVSELLEKADKQGVKFFKGWCLAENLEPLMPIREALRDTGLYHLIAGQPPPRVISAYLTDRSGMLVAKAERKNTELDGDIFASMLTAVGNFVMDSLSMMGKEDRGLNAIGYGKHTILIQSRGNASLACVIQGAASEFLIDDMKRILKKVGNRLDHWGGMEKGVADLKENISWFISSGKYDGEFLVDDPKLKQENLFDNILMGIQRASDEDPIIVFIDDLQWADSATLNLLHYLARNTRKDRVLILGTYRPEDILGTQEGRKHKLVSMMQDMSREDLFEKIELKRLGTHETERIIGSALDDTVLDEDFAYRIHEETEGNPFFVMEVIKMLVVEGFMTKQADEGWKLSEDIKDLDVPARVYEVIQRRLDRLMADQKEILECASIEGNEFRSEVIGNVLEINRLKLLKSLSDVEKKHKLVHSLRGKYRFDHTKITEVLYNGMIEDLRKEYHRLVADTLSDLYEDKMEEVMNELAQHYYKAEDERAVYHLKRAGNNAKIRFANSEAIRFYKLALEVLDKKEDMIDVIESLSDVYSLMGEYENAIELFNNAVNYTEDIEMKVRNLRKLAEVYQRKGDLDRSLEVIVTAKDLLENRISTEKARILVIEGNTRYRKGEFERSMSILSEAVEIFEELGGERDLGDAIRSIGNIYLNRGEFDKALEHYKKSLDTMESIGDMMGIASALNNMGIVYQDIGQMDRAMDHYRRSLEIEEKIGNKWGIAQSLNNIGIIYRNKNQLNKALNFYRRSLAIKEKIGDKRGIADTRNNIGQIYRSKGEIKEALKYYRVSKRIYEEIGDKQGVSTSLNNMGKVFLAKKDVESALKLYRSGLEIREKSENRLGVAQSLNSIGEAFYHNDELDEALNFYERCLNICSEIGDVSLKVLTLCGLSETCLKLDEIEKAYDYAERAIDMGEEEGITRRTLGMVYREMDEWDKAEKELEMAKDILDEVGDKRELARLYYEYALLLEKIGKVEKAKEYLNRALDIYEKMGMNLWIEKCKRALN